MIRSGSAVRLRRFDLPHVFGKDTLAEAESIAETFSKKTESGVDLRKLQLSH
jgi:hypothetical protein